MRGRPQCQTALGAVLKGLLGALEQCRHITASEAVQNLPRTGRCPGELRGICPALHSSRLGRAKLADRGGVAQGSGYKYFSRRATWPGAPASRSSPIRPMGRRASPCPGCVVYGAPIRPVEPGHVALAMPRARLTADTRRRVCVNESSASRDADTGLARRAMCAAKKTDRHTNTSFSI